MIRKYVNFLFPIITIMTSQTMLVIESKHPESKIYHYENGIVEEITEFEQKINYADEKVIIIRESRLNDIMQTKLFAIESINTKKNTVSLLQATTDCNGNYEEKIIEYQNSSPKKIDPYTIKTKVSKLIGKNPNYNQESK